MLSDFKAFIARGNVVQLAVGVVIGVAFGSVVQTFVNGFLNPLIALFGDASLDRLSFTWGTRTVEGEVVPNVFTYGAVLDAFLQFVLIAAVVFFLVVRPMNRLEERRRTGDTPEPTTRACPECLSEIPKAARRCSSCAIEIGSAV